MAKTTGTDKDVMEVMKKKNKQIMELTVEEEKEEKSNEKNMNSMEVGSKVNKIKSEVKNIDGFLAGSGNCRNQFCQCSIGKSS